MRTSSTTFLCVPLCVFDGTAVVSSVKHSLYYHIDGQRRLNQGQTVQIAVALLGSTSKATQQMR